MRKLLAWDVSYQLDPSWSNCLLPPPPPRKPTNPTVAKQGWERPPVDHCCHCRDDYGSTKFEKCLGLKGTNFTTEEVQTDLGRKWSSTVNKNYNVSTRELQLPRHCLFCLPPPQHGLILLEWSASEPSQWSTASLSVTVKCSLFFVCKHFLLFWDKLLKNYLSGFKQKVLRVLSCFWLVSCQRAVWKSPCWIYIIEWTAVKFVVSVFTWNWR